MDPTNSTRTALWPNLSHRARRKSTYELNLYLVPSGEPCPTEEVYQAILRWMDERGIVRGFIDDTLKWLAPGPRSAELFRQRGADVAFEYLIPYFGSRTEFVPNAHTSGFGARCRRCGEDLDEQLDAWLRQGDAVRGDARTAVLACPRCHLRNSLPELQTAIPYATANLYLNFCHVSSQEVCPEALASLAQLAGVEFCVVLERL